MTSGACPGAHEPWRRRWRRRRAHGRPDQPAPPHGPLGPRADGDHAAPAPQQRRAARHPGRRRAAPGPGPGGRDPRAVDAASTSRRNRSGCPRRDATRRPRRPPWPCARAWCARSPTTSTSTRASLPRADIAQLLCGEPSRLDTGWRRAIVGDPLRRLIAGEVAAAFDNHGHLVMEERFPESRCHPFAEGSTKPLSLFFFFFFPPPPPPPPPPLFFSSNETVTRATPGQTRDLEHWPLMLLSARTREWDAKGEVEAEATDRFSTLCALIVVAGCVADAPVLGRRCCLCRYPIETVVQRSPDPSPRRPERS